MDLKDPTSIALNGKLTALVLSLSTTARSRGSFRTRVLVPESPASPLIL